MGGIIGRWGIRAISEGWIAAKIQVGHELAKGDGE